MSRTTLALALVLAFVGNAGAQDDNDIFGEAEADAAEETSNESAAEAAADEPGDSTQGAETIPVETAAEPAEETDPDSVMLDAIEVTAQRRSERLVDVPLAVSKMTRDEVQSRRIERIDDLNSLAPGLQISRSPANTTISQMAIRGSSQINPAIYWDPAVGVYLDGVYIGKGQGSIFNVVDLAGVEVLRGPQGTLYGRNTIAGTINLISREPSGILAGHASVEYGNFNNQVFRAGVDLPTLGNFANLNLSMRSERRDPWIDTTPTSPVDGMNDRKNDGAHLGAVLDVGAGIEVLYHLDWSEVDQTNQFLQLVRSDNPDLQPYISTQRRDTADINAPSDEIAKILGHSMVVSWEATDWLTVKSITGYRDLQWTDRLDLDGSPEDVARSQRLTEYDQTSQDLNFSGTAGEWKYSGGVYYFKDDGYTVNPIFVSISGAPIEFDSQYGTHTKAWATYGQLDWNPEAVSSLTVSAGGRYTSEKKDLDRVFGFRTPPPVGPPPPFTYYMEDGYKAPGETFTDTSPMAAIAWRFTDGLNTYLRYAEGFKSGGFNGEYSNIQGSQEENQQETDTPFRPEKQRSVELGAKAVVLEGKGLVSIAAFQNKLDDLQVSIFTASGAAATVVRNAGKATIRGIEVETRIAPYKGTNITAHYAWLDPVYDEFIDAGENEADNRAFVHAPKNAWNLVVDQELWTWKWGVLRATLDYAWTDSFYTYPYQLAQPGDSNYNDQAQSAPNTEVEKHGLLNGRIVLAGIPLGGTRLGEVSLWGRNMLDEDTANNFIDFGPGFDNLTIANFVEPRSVGVSALFRW